MESYQGSRTRKGAGRSRAPPQFYERSPSPPFRSSTRSRHSGQDCNSHPPQPQTLSHRPRTYPVSSPHADTRPYAPARIEYDDAYESRGNFRDKVEDLEELVRVEQASLKTARDDAIFFEGQAEKLRRDLQRCNKEQEKSRNELSQRIVELGRQNRALKDDNSLQAKTVRELDLQVAIMSGQDYMPTDEMDNLRQSVSEWRSDAEHYNEQRTELSIEVTTLKAENEKLRIEASSKGVQHQQELREEKATWEEKLGALKQRHESQLEKEKRWFRQLEQEKSESCGRLKDENKDLRSRIIVLEYQNKELVDKTNNYNNREPALKDSNAYCQQGNMTDARIHEQSPTKPWAKNHQLSHSALTKITATAPWRPIHPVSSHIDLEEKSKTSQIKHTAVVGRYTIPHKRITQASEEREPESKEIMSQASTNKTNQDLLSNLEKIAAEASKKS